MDDPQVTLELFFQELLHIGVTQSVRLHHESSTLGYHDDVAV
jgi:hypothetical protein